MANPLTRWVPPILLDLYRSRRGPVRRFFGVFERFEDIAFESPWDSEAYMARAEAVLERTIATHALNPDPHAESPDPMPSCLTSMMVDLLAHRGPCRVLDFAGGAGVVYFRIQHYLTRPGNVTWHVVDNPRLAELGRKHARSSDRIEFLDALPEAGTPYDLVHVNTALQYLSDYQAVLGKLTEYGASHILLTELLATEQPTFLTSQLVEGSRVPCTFINFQELQDFLAPRGYELAFRCPAGYGSYTDWYDESVPPELREPESIHVGFARRPGGS